jgi:hypothetical protein
VTSPNVIFIYIILDDEDFTVPAFRLQFLIYLLSELGLNSS